MLDLTKTLITVIEHRLVFFNFFLVWTFYQCVDTDSAGNHNGVWIGYLGELSLVLFFNLFQYCPSKGFKNITWALKPSSIYPTSIEGEVPTVWIMSKLVKLKPFEVKQNREGHATHGKNYDNNQMQAGCLDMEIYLKRLRSPRWFQRMRGKGRKIDVQTRLIQTKIRSWWYNVWAGPASE